LAGGSPGAGLVPVPGCPVRLW